MRQCTFCFLSECTFSRYVHSYSTDRGDFTVWPPSYSYYLYSANSQPKWSHDTVRSETLSRTRLFGLAAIFLLRFMWLTVSPKTLHTNQSLTNSAFLVNWALVIIYKHYLDGHYKDVTDVYKPLQLFNNRFINCLTVKIYRCTFCLLMVII